MGGQCTPRPGTAASDSTPGLTTRLQLTHRPRKLAPPQSASVSCCVLAPPSRPAQRPQTVTRSPCGVCLQPPPHLPEIVPGPSPLATHRQFRCCNVIASVDSGLGAITGLKPHQRLCKAFSCRKAPLRRSWGHSAAMYGLRWGRFARLTVPHGKIPATHQRSPKVSWSAGHAGAGIPRAVS